MWGGEGGEGFGGWGVKWKSEKREVSSGWGFALVLWLLLFCVTLQCKGVTHWQVEQRESRDRNYLDVGKMDVGEMYFCIYMQKNTHVQAGFNSYPIRTRNKNAKQNSFITMMGRLNASVYFA